MASGRTTRHRLCCAVVALALAGPGCNWFNSTSPSDTVAKTETFSGTLTPQGSSVFTFTVSKTGQVNLTLTSVAPTATTPLGLGIGNPNGTACTTSTSTPNAIAGSAAQISVNETPGTYCVRVYDSGSLSGTVTFTVTVAHS